MDNAVQRARGYEDLLKVGEDGPYVFSQMFDTEGWRARSRAKRRFKLLRRIDPALRPMLRDGERVFFVSRGVAHPSVLEWYFLGAALYYMNQRAIVLTNQRILLLQIDWRMRPKAMRNQIDYASIAGFKNTVLGNTRISFHSGGHVLLTGLPRADRKWLARTFDRMLGKLDAAPARTELEHLCPQCFWPVREQSASCPACARPFKSPRRAALLSLVFPGAGDLYLGHNAFAYLELLGATGIWLGAAALGFDPSVGVLEGIVLVCFIVVFAHGFDAFTTHRIAKKGLIADSTDPQRWRFGAAAVIPLLALGSIALAAPSKLRLAPLPAVVSGDEMPVPHLEALRQAGYLEPGESVRYFYSAGATSVLQDGSLFTDDRVVSYQKDLDVDWHESARLDDVMDLHVELGVPGDLSWITVVRHDGVGFDLIVSTEGGGDRVFIDALTDRWRAARAGRPGGWFDGGAGASTDEAIVLRGVEDRTRVDSLELLWLGLWRGAEGTDWRLVERSRMSADSLDFDLWTLENAGGEQERIVFAAPKLP